MKGSVYFPLSSRDNLEGPSREEEWPSVREIPVGDYRRKAFRRRAPSAMKFVTIGSHAPKEGCKMQLKYVFIFSQTTFNMFHWQYLSYMTLWACKERRNRGGT